MLGGSPARKSTLTHIHSAMSPTGQALRESQRHCQPDQTLQALVGGVGKSMIGILKTSYQIE